jgi:hypothetical protein
VSDMRDDITDLLKSMTMNTRMLVRCDGTQDAVLPPEADGCTKLPCGVGRNEADGMVGIVNRES